jgi:protein-L-isoaspartate O-methyltransferase
VSDPKRTITLSDVRFHEFVPAEVQPYAYLDTPLPIGFGKTISQPFMVAVMTAVLTIRSSGSSYKEIIKKKRRFAEQTVASLSTSKL